MEYKKYFAPGRVNLIGEHLDYNGGLVLPAAITLGVTATFIPRSDNKIVLHSATHSFSKEISVDDEIEFDANNDWTNYPLGIIAQLRKENHSIPSCEITFESNLPEGSGLSSSAAVEVLTAYALLSQTESSINVVWLANFCKQVENDFIGVKCGIMDQYSVALGKKDNALLLDCNKIHHDYIPFELGNYRLVIMNSKKPRSLIHSKYNERKSECEEALKQIQNTKHEIRNLCDAEMVWIDILNDETLKKRTRHVISENLRVKEAVKVLEMNDLSTFGRLMNVSHASLKNDYEVTGIELDTLAETAQQINGCLGARMTGAGFGGCAIAIVHQSAMEEFKNKVSEKYLAVTGLNCEIYETQIGDGVHQLI
jgi:galactokinase